MSIREIIETERWPVIAGGHAHVHHAHNAAIDRILAAVTEYPELKIVAPVKGVCTCGAYCINNYGIEDPFCRKCGAKLKWDAE